ncbi:enoyl-CoA hydratase-related protein [Paraburkholderia phymatum]|uniref:enoyl-CoA hydratase-related protein n=1 Tax=Paraburkholderia phymatum TaxID=148447 RepID=UPI00317EA584
MSDVRVEISDRIATVTLERPPVNALTGDMFRRIAEVFRGFGKTRDANVAILTAPGERVFCAGVDFDDSLRRHARDLNSNETIADMVDSGLAPRDCFNAIMDCPLPVIGAINGAAVGAGAVIAACCDILIASNTARFSVPEIKAGVLGGGRHLQRLVGPYKARKMFFTGEFVDAHEFYRLGAVEAVVDPADLVPAAHALAAQIAAMSPLGLRLGKESLNRVEDLPVRDGYRIEQSYTAQVTRFNDSKEARSAQREKRPPEWTWT